MESRVWMYPVEGDFEEKVLSSPDPVLVDFWSPDCGPHLLLDGELDELTHRFPGRFRLASVNVEDQAGLAKRFGIQTLPTVLVFQSGQVVDTLTGAVSQDRLAGSLSRLEVKTAP